MFYINDDMSIYITRGDSAAFSVMAENGGAPYVFQPGEVVRFKVTERKNCTNVVLQKDVAVEEETDNVIILLDKSDTKIGEVISKPVDYWYEVERNPHTDPQTIIGYDEDGAKIFKLFPEGNDELPDIDEEDIPLIDDTLSLTSERPIQNQAVSRAIFGIIRAIEMDEDIPTEEYYGMKGATEDEDGSGGFVPAPKMGEQDFVLYGDGTWREPKGGGGGISQDEIQTAVNDALRIAKESGEFDGAPGATGPQGPKGDPYTLTETDKEEIAKEAASMVEIPEGGVTEETDPTVPAWAKASTKPTYTASEVGADASGTADSKVSAHNTSEASHNDIRLLISGLTARLNAIADSDDTTLDQLSEIVAYIKANKGLIDSITTDKVNVADIINNLTTSATNKPLSAKMGVELKALIDAIKIPTSLPASDVPSWAKEPTKPSYNKSEVGLGNVDNVQQYSPENPPPYPVISVNGKLGVVKLSASDVGADASGTASSSVSAHNTSNTAHSDIRALISQLSSEKVGKTSISLGIASDGLIYIFVDGTPVGMGIPQGQSGDVFGYVDENNTIVLNGNLADGTYSVKYEMDNGNVVNIGNMVLDSNVYYSVTSTLTNCTINNSAKTVVEGGSYAATITAKDGYELKSVTVTMGGSPVSVSGGNISIASVTGDIVITAVAEEVKAAEPVTTNITLTNGKRIGSDGTDRDLAGYCATEYIDLTNIPKPCTIHLTKAKWTFGSASETGTIMYYAWKADGSKLVGGYTNDTIGGGYFTLVRNNGKNTDVTVNVTSDEVTKIRFSGHWANGEVNTDWNLTNWDTVMQAEATLTYTPVS